MIWLWKGWVEKMAILNNNYCAVHNNVEAYLHDNFGIF